MFNITKTKFSKFMIGNPIPWITYDKNRIITGFTGDTLPVTNLTDAYALGISTTSFCQKGLVSLVLPLAATVPTYFFMNDPTITTVEIPSVTSLANGKLFQKCTSLKSITLPSKVTGTAMGWHCFDGCTKLSEILWLDGTRNTIPEGITDIGDYTFQNCQSLKYINLPSTLTSLGQYVFNGCSGLTELTIPAGVTTLKTAAMQDCTNLKKVTLKGINHDATLDATWFTGCPEELEVTLGDIDPDTGKNYVWHPLA